MEKTILTNTQAIDLAVMGYITLEGKTLFRRKRCDHILQAQDQIKQGEHIAETPTAVFILSPHQQDAVKVKPVMAF